MEPTTEVVEPRELEHVDDGAADFSIFEFLTTLALQKRFLLIATLGTGIVGVCFSFLVAPTYTATVTLMPPQQAGSAGSAALAQLGSLASLGGVGVKNPVDMYVALMRSVTVEDLLIDRFDLEKEYRTKYKSDTRKKLESNISIEANPKDGLIRLTLKDKNAARAAELANGYIDAYRSLSSTLAIGEAAQRRRFFEGQLEQAKNRLAAAEEDLKQTELDTGVVELDSQARGLIQQGGNLRAQISAKEVEIAAMRVYASSGNVDLMQAEEQLRSLRGELAKLGGETSGVGDLESSKKIPQAALTYVRKLREVKYNETLFDILARQYEIAKLDEAKEGAPIQVVDAATTPDHKSGPKRLYFLLGGLLLGNLFGTLIIVFQEGLNRNKVLAVRYAIFKAALLGTTS
jgi:uncharacterized protein involved in exopolysaccharide biosynthesis